MDEIEKKRHRYLIERELPECTLYFYSWDRLAGDFVAVWSEETTNAKDFGSIQEAEDTRQELMARGGYGTYYLLTID